LAAILLLILSPVMALVALAVRLSSPGPVLYTWKVIGHHGQEISSYKFRTMVQNADELKKKNMAIDEVCGPVYKKAKDAKVTKVGRVRRKFSLDARYQLLSGFKGDRSLV